MNDIGGSTEPDGGAGQAPSGSRGVEWRRVVEESALWAQLVREWAHARRGPVWVAVGIGLGLGLCVAATVASAVQGGFRARWIWFAVVLVFALYAAVRRGLTAAPGNVLFSLHARLTVVLALMDIAIWALAGAGFFFPGWTISGYTVLLGVHAVIRHRRRDSREQQLARRVDVLTRTRRGAVDVQAAELHRIERDLHDGAQARMVSLAMNLGLAEQLAQRDPDAVVELLAEARASALTAVDELRTVMRGIQPPVLSDRGLLGAIEALALDLSVPTTVTAALPGRPATPVESAVYLAVAECLANVVKHSHARTAWVTLRHTRGVLSVEVGDDGIGGAMMGTGTGLTGIVRRLELFDGTVRVHSPAGGPTEVSMEVPCELSSPKTSSSSATD
jgi:signal transduction histidine kinase